jgi:DNA-binding phage protein
VEEIKALNQQISWQHKTIGGTMSNLKIKNSREYREYLLESLVDVDRAANYIEVTLERDPEDPIPDLLRLVLSNVVEAQKNNNNLSGKIENLHEQLDRVLSETKGVEIYGLVDLLDALGFRLAVLPKDRD